jgi:hypothetical protein
VKRIGIIATAAVVVPALVLVLATPASAARPDLRVKSVRFGANEPKPYHVFHNRVIELHVIVVNEGGAPGGRGGGHFEGEAFTKRAGGLRFAHENNFDVPRIRPGKTRQVVVEVGGQDMDTYETRVCVTVPRDSGRGNNCRKGPGFAEIPRRWIGAVTSLDHPGGQPNLNLDSGADARFVYSTNVSNNTKTFVWGGSGPLEHTISGTDNSGCTWSGHGSNTIGPGEAPLVLKPNLIDYHGSINTTTTFPATISCGMTNFPFQVRTTALNISNKNRSDPNEAFLHGQATAGTNTYRWELEAQG